MKKLKYLLLAVPFAITLNSCDSDEQVDQLIDTVERGAILRTVSLVSNELPIGIPTAEFSVILEEQDQENGALLESVDVFLTFTDGSSDTGDSSNGIVDQEVSVGTITAEEFENGPNGLPRTQLTIPLSQMLSLVNLTDENIFGGDAFITRLVLNLTDGRSFTNDLGDNIDVNGNISSGSFFQSPFRYTTPVVCPVDEGTFVGEYFVEQLTPSIFGYDTFDPDGGGVILTLVEGTEVDDAVIAAGTVDEPELGSTQRAFDADYLASAGFDNTSTWVIDFICGETFFNSGDSGLQCTNGIEFAVAQGDAGLYDFQDDSSFVFIFQDDATDDCGQGAPDVALNFSRQ